MGQSENLLGNLKRIRENKDLAECLFFSSYQVPWLLGLSVRVNPVIKKWGIHWLET